MPNLGFAHLNTVAPDGWARTIGYNTTVQHDTGENLMVRHRGNIIAMLRDKDWMFVSLYGNVNQKAMDRVNKVLADNDAGQYRYRYINRTPILLKDGQKYSREIEHLFIRRGDHWIIAM
jgi:hypothetical protein